MWNFVGDDGHIVGKKHEGQVLGAGDIEAVIYVDVATWHHVSKYGG